MITIASLLIDWHRKYGRHDLPWQKNRDPYAIWVSEIMLQQTQVNTVIPYYHRFMQAFPTVASLADAPLEAVLALWSGLGYYSRARNLHASARIVASNYQCRFPVDRCSLEQLPGIGRSTAAAIAVFSFGQREAILDGNVKRVFARYFGIDGFPSESKVQKILWEKAEEALPHDYQNGQIEAYTQALMDLGATVCSRGAPTCEVCPLNRYCIAAIERRIDQLPTPKPRKSLPQKEVIFLFLLRDRKLFLQKRPTSGIWGGLWCLPEISAGVDVSAYCSDQWHIQVKTLHELPILNHQFTHFKLRIYPKLLTIRSEKMALSDDSIWIYPSEALERGIPTPVRKLLQRTFSSSNNLAIFI
ncbi:A/G-specific DNA-adenine glycosylase [Nitrosomonas sp. PY1]|uniref:A/G-specific adenine glycosylase n=1 Tax=Nitrosomonas sp. PY1 TaxID=1803906 RepID=UPI001FC80FFD|nr:A/G-specific adenine glycosylase [Nitrosomonas sp. PY1]GKS68459.1 A/G-specific DNA-adenine glycosylase [Nitrosomonas sp. PY1]